MPKQTTITGRFTTAEIAEDEPEIGGYLRIHADQGREKVSYVIQVPLGQMDMTVREFWGEQVRAIVDDEALSHAYELLEMEWADDHEPEGIAWEVIPERPAPTQAQENSATDANAGAAPDSCPTGE